MVSEYELNEVREVIEGPYRIVYLIDAEALKTEILAVIHSSRGRRKPVRVSKWYPGKPDSGMHLTPRHGASHGS